MDKLLQWAIVNQATESEDAPSSRTPSEMQKLDPGIIDAILGKDDATRMLECMTAIKDAETPLEAKEIAFDDLEMLIEGIDNAMNLENLRLWKPLLEVLDSPHPSLRMNAAWVCGTALQNNPKAQKAFMDNEGLVPMLRVLREDTDNAVRSKALYCISGLIKHFPEGFKIFTAEGGFQVLKDILNKEDDVSLITKTIFLLNSLVQQQFLTYAHLQKSGLIGDVIRRTEKDQDNEMIVEKTLFLILTLSSSGDGFAPEQKQSLKTLIPALKEKYPELLSEDDWKQIIKAINN
ncbi:hsp70 nucleotide exchange factor fes1 [Basidiobolus ranarum]|uniref:Hsp70 nucleotide exchange factor fes1 n=1 Tax=Basidiobolus ranarum TaxID=34480 RepID=A0ABR2WP58_9FUNG